MHWKSCITAQFYPIYNATYCHWGFTSNRFFKLQKERFQLLHVISIMPILNHYWKRLICSKLNASRKQKHWNYIKDTNKMNFQNILIQCSLNLMIIIHMIIDINLYQLSTKTSTEWLCVRHYISEILTKNPECITEILATHSFSDFSNYMENYYIQNYKENFLTENCYICQN